MACVKSKDTKPELIVRRFLHRNGFRYRLHCKKLPGKPDLVLPKYNIVIFINGCFWHSHPNCRRASIPKTNSAFWIQKLNKNVARDEANVSMLKSSGWNVVVIWQCQLSDIYLSGLKSNIVASYNNS